MANCCCESVPVTLIITRLEELEALPAASRCGVSIHACLRESPTPGAWIEGALRVARPGEMVRLLLEPDAKGGNVSPAWLLHWLDDLRHWTMQRRESGEVVVWLRKPNE